jgi:sulfur relay (sulfurtransferase) complex TusBCD TusD component (DsrE family)
MSRYLLIESRDPFDSSGFAQRCELALALRADGAEVTVFLVENGVLGARAAARLREVEKLAKSGVHLLADEFALRERGVSPGDIAATIRSVPLDQLVGQLVAGAKAIWN